MLIAYYDPKTKEVRVLSTADCPAVVVLSIAEEEAVHASHERFKTKGGMRAQVFLDARLPDVNNIIKREAMQQRLVAALDQHKEMRSYVAGLLNPALQDQVIATKDL